MCTSTVNCDVLVVGSGAGGLSAAITARKAGLNVIIVEKEPLIGGTTAFSGGFLWIPGNPHNAAIGKHDTRDAARIYLQHEVGNYFDPQRIDAFLDNGPRMLEFFERETDVKFWPAPAFPDYHPLAPGGSSGGRSVFAAPFDARRLGPDYKRLRPPLRTITFMGMMFNSGNDVAHFFNATKSLSSAVYTTKRLIRHTAELVRYGRGMSLTSGNALAARLLKSATDLGIAVLTSHSASGLLAENGRVSGALVQTEQGSVRFIAKCGVVLACGGFPNDKVRRRKVFPQDTDEEAYLSPAPAGNVGDGIRMAEVVGAQFQDDLPNAAAWIPVSKVPFTNGTFGIFPHLIDRYKPGIIAVDRRGRRFVNESNSYHDVASVMIRTGESEAEAWLVCDHKTFRKYGIGFAKAFPMPVGLYTRSGYLLRGKTLRELAGVAGIDPAGLEATVSRYNIGAEKGDDPEFGRGSNAYNRYLGDPNHHPNPCIAPLKNGPFYAVRIIPGDLGTFDGLRTDRFARVLDVDRIPIRGLYAVGNDMASIMGGSYPGAGIFLGPIMTFGFIAGRHLAGF